MKDSGGRSARSRANTLKMDQSGNVKQTMNVLKKFSVFVMVQRITLSFALALATGCATVYIAPDFVAYKVDHRNVALLPFNVTIDPTNKSKNVTAEEIEALEIEQGETFQRALYSQFLQGQQKGWYTVQFQDIDQTNALLAQASKSRANEGALKALTKSEICEILGVDAVVSGQMSLSKPMGNAAAIALRVLGSSGATNEGHINMALHEGDEGKLLWSYEHEVQGELLSSPNRIAKKLVHGVARTLPYRTQ